MKNRSQSIAASGLNGLPLPQRALRKAFNAKDSGDKLDVNVRYAKATKPKKKNYTRLQLNCVEFWSHKLLK